MTGLRPHLLGKTLKHDGRRRSGTGQRRPKPIDEQQLDAKHNVIRHLIIAQSGDKTAQIGGRVLGGGHVSAFWSGVGIRADYRDKGARILIAE